jgi:PAS domain S-box-containing protein
MELSPMSASYSSLDQLPPHVRGATLQFVDEACIIAITDLRGTIIYANSAFTRISGYPREELIGRNHRILKSGIHPPEFYRGMWSTIARGGVWTGEVCNRARDGHLYWVEATISPLRDATGRITHYCALRVDITARKQAQQQVLDAMEQSAERRHLESVGRMADGILHDLNNMLGGAMMLADPADYSDHSAEEQRLFLTRMAQLIRNVRDFSTGPRGGMPARRVRRAPQPRALDRDQRRDGRGPGHPRQRSPAAGDRAQPRHERDRGPGRSTDAAHPDCGDSGRGS